MSITLGATADLEICPDCYYWAHYGWEQGASYPEGWEGPTEPLLLAAVTVEHLCGCEQEEPPACSGHFSWTACDGCGSGLGGTRLSVRLWQQEETQ